MFNKKRFLVRKLSLLLVLSVFIQLFCNSVYAESNVISERLSAAMNLTDDLLPVRIELEDTLDINQMNNTARINAKLTNAEMLLIDEFAHNTPLDDNTISYMSREDFEIAKNLYGKVQNEDIINLAYKFDDYCLKRIQIMKKHYASENRELFNKIDCFDNKAEISDFLPIIYKVMLNREQIIQISKLPYILKMDIAEVKTPENMIVNSDRITRSNSVRAEGYNGSGIRIGVVELGYPITNQLTNSSRVVQVDFQNGDPTNDHSVSVINTIQQIAPNATIYIKPQISRFNRSTVRITEDLIANQGVHIVNLSIGICTNEGGYQQESRDFDSLVRRTYRTIVTSAGNSSGNINDISAAPNVITVGSVNSSGRTIASTSSYISSGFSSFTEPSANVNKPDICAPGENLTINNIGSVSGTSFSSPTVAAIIALMLNRNIWMMDKPQIIKAAVMVSARYHGSGTYVTNVSDKDGAGVIDALTCYKVAKNGRRNHYDFSSGGATSAYFDVYADNTTSPFRVAISWQAETINSNTVITDYDLYLYKGNTLVASSASSRNNYEIVEISPSQLSSYGAGYYRAEIRRYGSMKTNSDRVGIAWEQY